MGLRKFRRNLRKAERTFFNMLIGILVIVGLIGPIVVNATEHLSKWASKHNGEVFGAISAIAFLGLIIRILFKSKFTAVKYIDSKGYVVLTQSNELEHRHIAKQILGRELRSNEIVHHINGKRTDNDIRNLCVMDIEKHEHHHAWLKWKKDKSGRYPSIREQKRALEREYGGTLLENLSARRKA